MKNQSIDDMEIYGGDEPINLMEAIAMFIIGVGVLIIIGEYFGLSEFLIGLVK